MTNAARAVQYSRRAADRLDDRRAPARTRPRARRVTGTPASCSRRLNAPATAGRSSPSVRTLKGAGRPTVTAGPTSFSRPAARITSWSSAYLSTEPSVRSIASTSSSSTPSTASAATQSIASATPGGFWTSLSRIRATASATWTASVSEAPRTRRRTISTSRSRRRIVDPLVQAAALDRVVQVARAVRGQHDDRRMGGADRADLRDRHRRLGQQLEQERLEVVVGAVDLVDQQHRRPRSRMLERAQQRAADQVVAAEQVLLGRARCAGPRRAGCSSSWRG